MNENTQFLSGLPIPAGYRLKFDWNDTGPKGDSTINIIYEQDNKIHQITSNQVFRVDEPGSYSLFINLNECKLLNISVEQSDNCDRDRNHYVTCSIVKQQGRGGEQQLNRLFHAPLRGNNVVNWPFFLANPNIHKYGVPHLFHQEGITTTLTFNVPDGYSFVPISLKLTINMNDVSVNRDIQIRFFYDIVEFYYQTIGDNLNLNVTYNLYGFESNPINIYSFANDKYFKLQNLRLTDDYSINFNLVNSTVGDVISDLYIFGYLDLNII